MEDTGKAVSRVWGERTTRAKVLLARALGSLPPDTKHLKATLPGYVPEDPSVGWLLCF